MDKARALYYLPWIIAFSSFIEILDATIINIALPDISSSFGHSPIIVKIAVTSYLLSLSIFIPISGWLADRYGMITIFSRATFIFLLGSILCALSNNIWGLAAARLLQGAGGAMMMPIGRLILLRVFPKDEFIKVLNYVSIPAIAGFALGPIIGGIIITYTSWRWIFYLNIPFGILGIYMLSTIPQDFKSVQIKKFDSFGFFLLSLGLSSLSIGFEIISDGAKLDYISITLVCLSLLSFYLYIVSARNTEQAILNLNILKIRTFRLGLLGNFISRIGMGGIPYLLPILLHSTLKMSVMKTSINILPMAAGLLIMKIIGRKIIKAWGFKNLLVINGILLTLATFLLVFIQIELPRYFLMLILLAYGMSTSLQLTAMNAINYVDVPDKYASDATSMAAAVQQSAWGIGVAIAATLLTFFSNYFGSIPTFTLEAFRCTFISLGCICLLSVPIFVQLNFCDGKHVSRHIYK